MLSTSEKRRKPTNTKRKEEIDGFKAEIRKLQLELKLQSELKGLQPLTRKRGLPPLEQVIRENKVLASAIHEQQLDIVRAHATLPPLIGFEQENHPLHMHIRLNKNWHDRKMTLLRIREQKSRDAYEYIMARSRLSSSSSSSSNDRFETTVGDVCAVLFQTVEFPGMKSLKQVCDAVLFSVHNAEISISERLGHITTRDDYECGYGNTHNVRIVSTNGIGVSTELNCVMLAQFFNGDDESFGDEPCGIIALESVDEDELYPHKPNECLRKDVSSAVLVTADPPQSKDDELVATLRRAAFVKFHRPQFDISDVAWQKSQQEASRWGDVMLRTIRSELYSMP